MDLLRQLSSARGEATSDANAAVAERVLTHPEALDQILAGLLSKDVAVAGDCAEVMTKIAESCPEAVAPHAPILWNLTGHKNGRVRWESMQAFSLAAAVAREVAGALLSDLIGIIQGDKSVVVRDYAIDAVAAHGRTGVAAARKAFPILVEALAVWDGKHAARTLTRLGELAQAHPSLWESVRAEVEPYRVHERSSVQKAARAVLRVGERKK